MLKIKIRITDDNDNWSELGPIDMYEVQTTVDLIVDPDADADDEADTYVDGVKTDVDGVNDDKQDPGYKVRWIFKYGDSS